MSEWPEEEPAATVMDQLLRDIYLPYVTESLSERLLIQGPTREYTPEERKRIDRKYRWMRLKLRWKHRLTPIVIVRRSTLEDREYYD